MSIARITLPAHLGGGFVTLRCGPDDRADKVVRNALDKVRKKRVAGAGELKTSLFALQHGGSTLGRKQVVLKAVPGKKIELLLVPVKGDSDSEDSDAPPPPPPEGMDEPPAPPPSSTSSPRPMAVLKPLQPSKGAGRVSSLQPLTAKPKPTGHAGRSLGGGSTCAWAGCGALAHPPGELCEDHLRRVTGAPQPSSNTRSAPTAPPAEDKSTRPTQTKRAPPPSVVLVDPHAPKCSVCQLAISGAYFKMQGEQYHAECFTCCVCDMDLNGKPFSHQDGQLYCELDYHKAFGSTCVGCGEVIMDRILRALDAEWHAACFTCCHCLQPLEGGSFFVEDSNVYCPKDHDELFAIRCQDCNGAIKGQYVRVEKFDGKFHPECLKCTTCNTSLSGLPFYCDDNSDEIFCTKHYEERGTRCHLCARFITSNVLYVDDLAFHDACFRGEEPSSASNNAPIVDSDEESGEEDGFGIAPVTPAQEVLDEDSEFSDDAQGSEDVALPPPPEASDDSSDDDSAFRQPAESVCVPQMPPHLANTAPQHNKTGSLAQLPPKKSHDLPSQAVSPSSSPPLPSSPISPLSPSSSSASTFSPTLSPQATSAVPEKKRERGTVLASFGKKGDKGTDAKLSKVEVKDKKKKKKHKKKKHGSDSDDDDEVVGHVKYKDMINAKDLIPYMQKGIERSLQKSPTKFSPDYRKKDMFRLTHNKEEYGFMDYAPSVFFSIRKLFGISQTLFTKSLVLDGITGGALGAGKSGMLFFFSKDKRFVIKTITRAELKFFRKIMRKYYTHMTRNLHSLLPRFYAMWKITLEEQKPLRVIVMNNLFRTPISIHEKYDLKGSTRNRFVDVSKEGKRAQGVLKDLNFTSKLFVGSKARQAMRSQMMRDTDFLTEMNIMDQSLLLGIHRGGPDTPPGPSKGLDVGDTARQLKSTSSGEPDLVNCFQFDHGGVRGYDERKKAFTSDIYLFGIIDILQMYDLKKKLESTYKGIKYNKKAISAVNSKRYGDRFLEYMDAHME